jgi:hypothetical protein
MGKIAIFVAAVVLVFSASVFGEQNPMIADVRAVSVTIDHAGLEPNKPLINWTELEAQIVIKLKEAEMRVPAKIAKGSIIPDLRITIMMLTIPETEQVVFHIQTSLYRFVAITERSGFRISAPVWMSSATMQSVAATEANDVITKAALRHVEAFIKAWKAAQTKTSAQANENNNGMGQNPTLQTATAAATGAAQTEKTYVASKNSKVFHLASCPTAKTISAENLITFASREDAVASGRRPCKKCNP